jgi:type II restriction enzyme
VIAAFEIEKSTSSYSGILYLSDLSFTKGKGRETLYLVMPGIGKKMSYYNWLDLRLKFQGL